MSEERFIITRKIEIDAGHRLPFHDSKCRNLHGHRYVIEATCSGPLVEQGSEKGMVMDFSFLKEEMIAAIDATCDHGFIVWAGDEELLEMFFPGGNHEEYIDSANKNSFWAGESSTGMKLYIMSSTPTAENLTKHWYELLQARINRENVILEAVRVWETPNCSAQYPV